MSVASGVVKENLDMQTEMFVKLENQYFIVLSRVFIATLYLANITINFRKYGLHYQFVPSQIRCYTDKYIKKLSRKEHTIYHYKERIL